MVYRIDFHYKERLLKIIRTMYYVCRVKYGENRDRTKVVL